MSDRAKVWLVIVGVLVVLGIIGLIAGPNKASGGGSTKSGSTDHAAAFEICKKFVSARLKAPSGATWRDPFGDQVTYSVAGSDVTVNASVDSENGFGAKIRSPYVCTVTNTSGDSWRLVNLDIQDGGA
jgi:predicted metalloprotease